MASKFSCNLLHLRSLLPWVGYRPSSVHIMSHIFGMPPRFWDSAIGTHLTVIELLLLSIFSVFRFLWAKLLSLQVLTTGCVECFCNLWRRFDKSKKRGHWISKFWLYWPRSASNFWHRFKSRRSYNNLFMFACVKCDITLIEKCGNPAFHSFTCYEMNFEPAATIFKGQLNTPLWNFRCNKRNITAVKRQTSLKHMKDVIHFSL